MLKDEYRVMFQVEDSFWWYVSMRRIIFTLLEDYFSPGTAKERIHALDAGCGTGAIMAHLRDYGLPLGIDLAGDALRYCRERGLQAHELVQGSVMNLPLTGERFDLVISLDVFCCLEKDEAAFAEVSRVLKEGGMFIVNLPAYGFLRSEHDLAVNIQHRYTAAELRQRLETAGLAVGKITYVNTLLFPIAATVRLLKRFFYNQSAVPHSDLDPPPRWLNLLLTEIMSLEAKLVRRWNLPFGLSVLGIAYK
jgi:ubiquinone/menaquinone biosynthesis C-methylase UbiE